MMTQNIAKLASTLASFCLSILVIRFHRWLQRPQQQPPLVSDALHHRRHITNETKRGSYCCCGAGESNHASWFRCIIPVHLHSMTRITIATLQVRNFQPTALCRCFRLQNWHQPTMMVRLVLCWVVLITLKHVSCWSYPPSHRNLDAKSHVLLAAHIQQAN